MLKNLHTRSVWQEFLWTSFSLKCWKLWSKFMASIHRWDTTTILTTLELVIDPSSHQMLCFYIVYICSFIMSAWTIYVSPFCLLTYQLKHTNTLFSIFCVCNILLIPTNPTIPFGPNTCFTYKIKILALFCKHLIILFVFSSFA